MQQPPSYEEATRVTTEEKSSSHFVQRICGKRNKEKSECKLDLGHLGNHDWWLCDEKKAICDNEVPRRRKRSRKEKYNQCTIL